MNSYYPLALLLARQESAAQSALPDAPTIVDEDGVSLSWSRSVRSRIATALHREAWFFEPAETNGSSHP